VAASRGKLLAGALTLLFWTGQQAAPATSGAPDAALAQRSGSAPERAYRLRLFNTHTGERADVVYRLGESYLPDGIAALERQLRDHRRGEVSSFDPRLFDLLVDLAAEVGHPGGEFHVISGYRSPATNEMLRQRSAGVAKGSLHTRAQAIDVRLPGVSTRELRDAALRLGRGGVGYYERSDFVHVDTGRVRRW
jgi:uncharacterized protein YcbK (DUF882 family)